MRVLVTGSRDLKDAALVDDTLNDLHVMHTLEHGDDEPFIVVHGDCPTGADRFAAKWAERYSVLYNVLAEPHPADWKRLGKAAGNARNQVMVDKGADICVAFYQPGAANRGTADCAARAAEAGIEVRSYTGEA